MRNSLNAVVERLDRMHEFLKVQSGSDFLAHLLGSLAALADDSQLAPFLADFERRADTLREGLLRFDAEARARFIAYRAKLSEKFSEQDDEWQVGYSLKNFDRIMAGEPDEYAMVVDYGPASLPRTLEHAWLVLNAQTNSTDVRNDDDRASAAAVQAMRQEELQRFRALAARRRVCPGHALRRLQFLAHQLNPRGLIGVPLDDAQAIHFQELGQYYGVEPRALESSLWESGEDAPASGVAEAVPKIRTDVALVFEALRTAVGGRLSRVESVMRFKRRCEWYDAERLRALAEGVQRKRAKERPFTDELARFLYDEGHEPITEAMVAGLRADILSNGPSGHGLYVECKQYDARSAGKVVRDATRQIWSTVGRLKGTPQEVREAFLVIFRRAGPLLSLPDPCSVDGVTLFPILVDVAPNAITGSRERSSPLAIDVDDLRPDRRPLKQRTRKRVRA